MRSRYYLLALMAALLGVYAFVLSHNLRSIFLIVTYTWGWVAVAALFGRLEAIKAMSATMTIEAKQKCYADMAEKKKTLK